MKISNNFSLARLPGKENKSEWIAAFKAVGIKIGSSLHIFTLKCVRGDCALIRDFFDDFIANFISILIKIIAYSLL